MKPCECGGTEIVQDGIKKEAEKYQDIFDERFYYWKCTKCGKSYDIEQKGKETQKMRRSE